MYSVVCLSTCRKGVPPANLTHMSHQKFPSTRLEKSGSKDWNLLGLRGTEAIQVSSHRGPPTDRPPDIPPPAVGVFAGHQQERAGTRHLCQLAFFSRSVHCLSGLTSARAANALFWGVVPSNNTAFSAVGTSQRDTALPRYGQFRVNGIRV
jgi:hypothetical protein